MELGLSRNDRHNINLAEPATHTSQIEHTSRSKQEDRYRPRSCLPALRLSIANALQHQRLRLRWWETERHLSHPLQGIHTLSYHSRTLSLSPRQSRPMMGTGSISSAG